MSAETRRHSIHGKGIRYRLEAEHRYEAKAEQVADVYMDVIVDSIVNQPRSLQKRIGPSEMGIECSRAILHKINGDAEPARNDVPWKATIGTAVHAYLEEAFTAMSADTGEHPGRWITERRVTVGTVAGTPITGSTDLFDTWTGTVLDHKVVGKSTGQKYRAHGPSAQYERQAHLYGKGWEDAGHRVEMVAICFLPREGELTDTFIWTAPYDRAVAETAIARVDGLATLLGAVGIDTALTFFPTCDDRWCRWCGSGSSFGARTAAATTADLFKSA